MSSAIEEQYRAALAALCSDAEALSQVQQARTHAASLASIRAESSAALAELAELQRDVATRVQVQFDAIRQRTERARHVRAEHARLISVQRVACAVRSVDELVRADDFVAAARFVRELRSFDVPGAAVVVREDVVRRLDAVVHRVGDVFVRLLVDVSAEHWHVRAAVPCRADAPTSRQISVSDALAALQAMGEFEAHVARLVRRLVRLMLPRVAAGAELAVVGERLVASAASAATAPSLERALAAARVLLTYAKQRLPALLFEPTLAKLAPELAATLAPLLDFDRFAEQRELVAEFERTVADVGLATRLADGEQRHAARLHAAALEQVRAAVTAPSYPNPNETVDVAAAHAQLDREERVAALLNGASPWRVTSAAQRLAAQIGAAATPALALDMVTLYGCAVRARAAQIAAVPAQALLLLADVQHLVRVVRSRGVSLGVVLQLRALEHEADAVFEAVCAAQCAQIDESWATAGGAANTNAPARQQSVSRACQRIELQLTRLARALADSGPRNAAAQIVTRAARHARDVVSGAVLALKDIAADECTALQTTLAPLAAALDALLGESNKLRAVVDVLPMSILELHAALPRLSKALSGRELTHLVSAMFQQSEKRSKLLAALSSHDERDAF